MNDTSTPPVGSEPQEDPKFQLSIETQVLKCMESGSYVAPDPVAFKSFASCEGDTENDGSDDSDLFMFVITPDSVHEDSGFHRASGISMLWVDSQSPTGYTAKHITEGDPRFAAKRAVYVDAIKVLSFAFSAFGTEVSGDHARFSADSMPRLASACAQTKLMVGVWTTHKPSISV